MDTSTISTGIEWWDNPRNLQIMEGISRAYQGKGSFPTRLDTDEREIAFTDFTRREVVYNPENIPKRTKVGGSGRFEAVDTFELCKGVVLHEACHRRFTDPIESTGEPWIDTLWNLLEDGRIEKVMITLHPYLEDYLLNLHNAVLSNIKPVPDNVLHDIMIHSFRRRTHRRNRKLLDEDIEKLVDSSFDAEDSAETLEIAKEIASILGIESKPDEQIPDGMPQCGHGHGDRDVDDGPAEKLKDFEVDDDGNPVDSNMEDWADVKKAKMPGPMEAKPIHPDGSRYDDNVLVPVDAKDLWGHAKKLVEPFKKALEVIDKTEVYEPSRSGGKLKVQQWIKDNELPFRRSQIVNGLPPIAVGVIVDCSTSMYQEETCRYVSVLAMALYMACHESDTTCRVVTAPGGIEACTNKTVPSIALPMIAGMSHPWAGYEQMSKVLGWQGEWLDEQEEDVKLLFTLHDGMSNDKHIVPDTVKRLNRKGVRVMAIGLGIRSQGLSEQYGADSYIQMNDVTLVSKRVAQVINNLRRR